jgi:hypothetical protein
MSLGFCPQKIQKREEKREAQQNTRHFLHPSSERMSAVAVTPGAVAKIRESKIVTDELNVQVRSRSCSLSFFPSLSLSLSVCVCVCVGIRIDREAFKLSLSLSLGFLSKFVSV